MNAARPAPLSLAALRARVEQPSSSLAPSETMTQTTALLSTLAAPHVGDLVADLDDQGLNRAFAVLIARVVALRDGQAS